MKWYIKYITKPSNSMFTLNTFTCSRVHSSMSSVCNPAPCSLALDYSVSLACFCLKQLSSLITTWSPVYKSIAPIPAVLSSIEVSFCITQHLSYSLLRCLVANVHTRCDTIYRYYQWEVWCVHKWPVLITLWVMEQYDFFDNGLTRYWDVKMCLYSAA